MVVAVDPRGRPGSEASDDPSNQPPGHLGISALMFDGEDADRFWAMVRVSACSRRWITRSRGRRVTAGFARLAARP